MPMRHRASAPKMKVGDRVRVHETAEAVAAGVAGLVGAIVGIATPPAAGAVVIGAVSGDQTVNVSFAEKAGAFWFAKEQLDILGPVPSSGTKSPGAEHEAAPDVAGEAGAPAASKPKPWWKFGRG